MADAAAVVLLKLPEEAGGENGGLKKLTDPILLGTFEDEFSYSANFSGG